MLLMKKKCYALTRFRREIKPVLKTIACEECIPLQTLIENVLIEYIDQYLQKNQSVQISAGAATFYQFKQHEEKHVVAQEA